MKVSQLNGIELVAICVQSFLRILKADVVRPVKCATAYIYLCKEGPTRHLFL